MDNLMHFSYESREVRIIKDEKGNLWWVANDVCEVLDLANTTEALRGLDDDEKSTLRISEGGPERNIINEPGLYTLIIRSNKPEAKPFKRWITHEVLPSIRKNGFYAVPRKGKSNILLNNNPRLKMTHRLRLLVLAWRMTQMDQQDIDEMYLYYNQLCGAFVADRRLTGRLGDAELFDFYFHALMDDGPMHWGLECGQDEQGNRFFLALTSELVKVFGELGKERGLPDFPYSDVQFGLRFVRNRHELKKLGWARGDEPAKIVKGYKYYKYTLINDERD